MDVIDRVPGLGHARAGAAPGMADERLRHRAYTREHGDDPADVRDWTWPRAERVRLLVVNAGSSSLKLRLLDDADARSPSASSTLAARRRPFADRCARRPAGGRRRRAPRRARRRATSGRRSWIDDGVRARLRGADRPRAAAPAACARGDRRASRGAAGRAGRRVLRHRVPRHAAAGGGHVRAAAAGASAGRCAGTASTGSRTPTPRGAPPSCWAPGRDAARHLPPRRGRVARRGRRRALGRHHDGLHAARRARDGDALGQRRPRARCCG